MINLDKETTNKRNLAISLEEAKEWYNSNNNILKELALKAFNKDELFPFDYTKIKTFDNVMDYLCKSDSKQFNTILDTIYYLNKVSKASVAMFKLNIVRKILNTNYKLHLTKDAEGEQNTWYPYFRFIVENCPIYKEELEKNIIKKIGKITSEGVTYNVLGGRAIEGGYHGLGNFNFKNNTGLAYPATSFFGCATKNIAKHFGTYFGMLVIEAMYSDMIDFKIIEKY